TSPGRWKLGRAALRGAGGAGAPVGCRPRARRPAVCGALDLAAAAQFRTAGSPGALGPRGGELRGCDSPALPFRPGPVVPPPALDALAHARSRALAARGRAHPDRAQTVARCAQTPIPPRGGPPAGSRDVPAALRESLLPGPEPGRVLHPDTDLHRRLRHAG